MVAAIVIQGRGHRREREAPTPFAGPIDFVSRFVAELASGVPGVAFRPRERRAPVYHEHVTGDVAREVRQQEPYGVPDVPAGALDLARRPRAPAIARSGAHAALVDHGHADSPGSDAVTAE